MKGKNKLVPRLLGITKESVMRVDEKTKEVIQEWNLTNIKRWAASPKSFTLVRDGTPPLIIALIVPDLLERGFLTFLTMRSNFYGTNWPYYMLTSFTV